MKTNENTANFSVQFFFFDKKVSKDFNTECSFLKLLTFSLI